MPLTPVLDKTRLSQVVSYFEENECVVYTGQTLCVLFRTRFTFPGINGPSKIHSGRFTEDERFYRNAQLI